MTNIYAVLSPEGAGGVAAGFQWYARQVLGLFMGHATYTALIGAGIGIARQLPSRRRKVIAIVMGFLVAIAAHFSWDAWLSFFPIESSLLGLVEVHLRTVLMTGPFTAGVVVLLVLGLRNESAALADQLRKEAALGGGTVLPQEVAILTSPWKRWRERMRAVDRGNVRAYFTLAGIASGRRSIPPSKPKTSCGGRFSSFGRRRRSSRSNG